MLSQLHALLHEPEGGWDPVPLACARGSAEHECGAVDHETLRSEEAIGRIQQEHRPRSRRRARALRLGDGRAQRAGGMGRRVERLPQGRPGEGLEARVSRAAPLDRLSLRSSGVPWSALRHRLQPRVRVQPQLRRPHVCVRAVFARATGGYRCVDMTNLDHRRRGPSALARGRTWFNERIRRRIGYPMPPPERAAGGFLRLPVSRLCVE